MAMKKKIKISRRAKTGLGAAPESSFQHFNDYIRMDVDKKEISSFIKTHIKKIFSKSEAEVMLACPDYYFAPKHFIVSSILWEEKGFEFPVKWNAKNALDKYFGQLKSEGIGFLQTKKQAVEAPARKSPAEIIKDKTSAFIADMEAVLDSYDPKQHKDQMQYSPYNELTIGAHSQSTAKAVVDYYTPIRDEWNELVTQKTPDLVEAYSNIAVRDRKKYLEFVQHLVDDASKYLMSKKATRAPRKARVKTADKQIAKLNYLTESNEYKLKSIHPMSIVGCRRLYTFHVKYKTLTEYVSHSPKGFEVKGSTLQGLDTANSRMTKLRKPNEVLSVVLGKTPTQVNKMWGTLTTKTEVPNGRINKDTILLRALDK